MAMYQNQSRACVEFLKSSGGLGKGRIIKLNYGPQGIPPQLVGRMDMVRTATVQCTSMSLARVVLTCSRQSWPRSCFALSLFMRHTS